MIFEPVMRTDEHHNLKHPLLVELGKTDIQVLFFGDSLTRRWEDNLPQWEKFFGDLKAANFGVGADTIENMKWRLLNGEIDHAKPKVVVFLAGTNNLSTHESGEIAENLCVLLDIIHEKIPAAKILIQGLYPRDKDDSGVDFAAKIPKVNALLASYAKKHGYAFADFGPLLCPDGKINRVIQDDGLHLNAKGYEVIGPELSRRVRELLGSV